MPDELAIEDIDRDGAVAEATSELGSTRSGLLRRVGLVAGGGLVAGIVPMALVRAQSGTSKNDVKILNYALTLEYLERPRPASARACPTCRAAGGARRPAPGGEVAHDARRADAVAQLPAPALGLLAGCPQRGHLGLGHPEGVGHPRHRIGVHGQHAVAAPGQHARQRAAEHRLPRAALARDRQPQRQRRPGRAQGGVDRKRPGDEVRRVQDLRARRRACARRGARGLGHGP